MSPKLCERFDRFVRSDSQKFLGILMIIDFKSFYGDLEVYKDLKAINLIRNLL